MLRFFPAFLSCPKTLVFGPAKRRSRILAIPSIGSRTGTAVSHADSQEVRRRDAPANFKMTTVVKLTKSRPARGRRSGGAARPYEARSAADQQKPLLINVR